MKLLLSLALLTLSSTFSVAQDTAAEKCPSISVVGPAGIVGVGELATYTAAVSDADQYSLEYVWSVSAGRIKDGQGTKSIRVIRPNSSLSVSVEVRGLPSNCPVMASETDGCGLVAADPVKVYELQPNAAFNKASAMDVAQVMLENPSNQLYILAGDVGRKNSPSFQQKQISIIDLLSRQGITKDRITIASVYSDVELFQFWRVPPGANNPKCEECNELEKKRSECPSISVTGPASVVEPGESMTFLAELVGTLPRETSYTWSLDGGEILKGQGTLKLTARYAQSTETSYVVTATLTVLGLPDECQRTASATYAVAANRLPTMIDEFSRLSLGLQADRIGNAVMRLGKYPASKLHVIEYFPGGTSERAVTQRVSWITAKLKQGKLRPQDFQVVVSETPNPKPLTKIYIVPLGAATPTP